MAVDNSENVYISAPGLYRVRKVSQGIISTFADPTFPVGIAVDTLANVYVVVSGPNGLAKISPGGAISTIVSGVYEPTGVTTDASGNVYMSDRYRAVVRQFSPVPAFCSYSVSGLAGAASAGGGTLSSSVTVAAGCNWTS